MQQNPPTLPQPAPFMPAQRPVPLDLEDLAKVSGAGLPVTSLPAGSW